MIFILFNAFGDEFQPLPFIEKFNLKGFQVSEKGSPLGSRGLIHKQSGFSVSLEESISSLEATDKMSRFIIDNTNWLLDLMNLPVEVLFNVGMTVGAKDSFVPFLKVDAELLQLLADKRIGLNIYGYPTGEDSNDDLNP